MKLTETFRWFIIGTSIQARRVRQAAKFLVLVALFLILFWIIPIEEVIRTILTADILNVALGLAFGFVATFFSALQMWILISKQGIQLEILGVWEVHLAAKFYSQFAAGNIVASGFKWFRFSKPDGKPAEALAAIGFFRLLLIFLNIATGLFFWLLSGQGAIQINWIWLIVLVLGLTLIWIVITRYSLPVYKWMKAWGGERFNRAGWHAVFKRLDKFILAVAAYADLNARDILFLIFTGIAAITSGVFSQQFLGRSVGIELSFWDMGWIRAVLILLTQLPFAVAGGLGIREVSVVFMLTTFYGIDASLSLAFSFMLFVRSIVIGLTGGVLEAIGTLRTGKSPDLDTVSNDFKDR